MARKKVRLDEDNAKKPRVRVKRGSHGLGLFAEEDIKRGTLVAEYFGSAMTRRQANNKGGRYLFATSENRVIDGSLRRNIARYINHQCKPNCEVYIKRGRIFIETIRRIKHGDELGYDYGKEYFDDIIKSRGCECWSCAGKERP